MAQYNEFIYDKRDSNPWLASATYEEKDAHRFKGRKADTDKIISMLQQNECVVCYAASGDGKSSLLNAGVCPSIRKIGFFPIKITFSSNEYEGIGLPRKSNENNSIDFDAFILAKINQDIENYRHRFIKEHGLDEYDITFERIARYEKVGEINSLWWKLRTETIQLSYGEFDYIPVIIFDQFEEIFRASWKHDFFIWLESLMKETCPIDLLHEFPEEFDDFPTRKMFKAIFSMRYEYIGELDYWCSQKCFIPQLIRSRYYLRALNVEQARQVICEQTLGDKYVLSVIKEQSENILSRLLDLDPSDLQKCNIDISAILLSIMCYSYYNKLISNSNDTDLPSAKDLVSRYYNDICRVIDPIDLLGIEKSLVSGNGNRKRVRKDDVVELNKSIAIESDARVTIGDLLLTEHILRQYIINNEAYIELAHDKIAEVVKDKVDTAANQELQRKNREINREKRLISENVLTIFGRELIENQLYEFGSDIDDSRKSIASRIIESNFSPENALNRAGVTSLSQMINDSDSSDRSLCISFIAEDGRASMTKDGIYNLWVQIDALKRVTKVLFYDKIVDSEHLILTRNGFCGIELEYDGNTDNEIKRTYLGKDGKPTHTLYCYSIVKREYDNYNRPIKTSYFEADGITPCKHIYGNYGFTSSFDDSGNEVLRRFFDADGNASRIQNGIWGQKAIYENNLISYVINIDDKDNPCKNFFGNIAVHIEYDKYQRCYKETFCDERFKTLSDKDGYSITIINYNDKNLVSGYSFYDALGNKVLIRDGYHRFEIKYNQRGFPKYILRFGLNDDLVFSNSGDCVTEIVYNDIGQEVENYLLGPDLAPSYSITGFSILNSTYSKHLRIKTDYRNHQNIPIVSYNRNSFLAHEWDESGRHIICETRCGIIQKKTIYEWLDDNTYIAKDEQITRKCIVDSAGRVIYEEDLNQTDGPHHKVIEYDSHGRRSIERYYTKDNKPYFDDEGDCATEFIYDELSIVGIASLGVNGRHRNTDGYCIYKVEQNEQGQRRCLFYDVDEKTRVINLSLGAHMLDFDGSYYDENLQLCNSSEGYAYIEKNDNLVAYFNKDGNPAAVNGVHKYVREQRNNIEVTSAYGVDEKLIDTEDGYAIKTIKYYGNFSKLFLQSSMEVRYYDKYNKPVDGPNPIEQTNTTKKGCYFRLSSTDGHYEICYAKSASGARIEGSRWKDIGQALFITLIFIPGVIYGLFYGISSQLKNRKNKSCQSQKGVIYIKEINAIIADPLDKFSDDNTITSLAKVANLQQNDIILRYGDWEYTNYKDFDESVYDFQKEFDNKRHSFKKITVGRISNGIPIVDSFWVPGIVLGLNLGDGTFSGTDDQLNSLIELYNRDSHGKTL